MISSLMLQDERFIAKLFVTCSAYFILISLGLSSNIYINAKEIAMNITNTNTHTGSADKAELFFDKTTAIANWRKDVILRYPKSTVLTLKDGIKHIRMTKYINGRPVRINVVEVNTKINEKISIKPVMASDVLNRKSSIKSMAIKGKAIAAINGSYFKPQTGVPLGTMMIDGQILTGPVYNRVALGIKKNEFLMDRLSLNGKLISSKNELKIDNINQPRMLSTYVITYNRKWGKIAPPPPKYGAEIAIEDGKVIDFGMTALPIPENGYVIVGPKMKLKPFVYEKDLKLELKAGDEHWADVEHIISGGPYLVKENQVYVDVTEEKLKAVAGRNPRTAIGYTLDGRFIMVTVDGREEKSIGMTLTELANFMKSIGCYNAMNLDGGGSSIMYFNGYTVNKPSIKGGIALSNALVIYEDEYPEEYASADIKGS